jgi:hypothetical protein
LQLYYNSINRAAEEKSSKNLWMAIHIGRIIQKEVESQRLTHREFGAMIHRNEKTIPDIFDRASMSIDLLITISVALKKDFLNTFYSEEPMKSIRNNEVANEVQRLNDEHKLLKKELSLTRDLNEAQKEIISLAKEQLEDYKNRVKELLSKRYTTKENIETTAAAQENKE